MLVNAVVLISAGQVVRTPQMDLRQMINFSKYWDPKKSHLLLDQFGFVNGGEDDPRHPYVTLEKVSRMVFPYGWLLVTPLVISGVETLALMSASKVGKSSYINPHGDLSWVTFGKRDMDIYE